MAVIGIRAQKKALRPSEILEAAFQEFSLRGYEAARIEDIAARLGVTKGTVYFYFPTKEALFFSLMDDLTQSLLGGLTVDEGGSLSARDRLIGFMRRCYARLTEDRRGREALRFIMSEGRKFPKLLERHRLQFHDPVSTYACAIVASGVASGEFREKAKNLPAEIIMSPILSVCMSILMSEDNFQELPADYFHLSIDTLLNGLLAS